MSDPLSVVIGNMIVQGIQGQYDSAGVVWN